MQYKFCMGTCNGQCLGFSCSISRSNRSLARLLAGVVNLNAKLLTASASVTATARAQWAELRLNGERVVVQPLALSGYDIFLSMRTPISRSPCLPRADFIPLQLAHIASLMLSPPHEARLAKVLQCMHSHYELQAARGTYAETAGAGAGDDMAEILNAHWVLSANSTPSSNDGADLLADVEVLLEGLEAFEDHLVKDICVDGPRHYEYMFQPMMQLLGEGPGERVRGLHLFHAPPLEGMSQLVSLVYSAPQEQEQEDDEEAAAAARACRRWENCMRCLQLGGLDEDASRTGRTLVFIPNAGENPNSDIGTGALDAGWALIVASCGGGREDLVLVATVPACSCSRAGAERTKLPCGMSDAANTQLLGGETCSSLRAWPISVLSPLLRLAWQESIQRIGEAFHTFAPNSAFEHTRRSRPADTGGAESSSMHFAVSTAGAVSSVYASPVGVGLGLDSSPFAGPKREPAATPPVVDRQPGLVGKMETSGNSELRTPARVPVPPGMPPSSSASASAIKGRAGRTLRLAE